MFEGSLEILKISDAVYFYVSEGLPDDQVMSEGMKEVKNLAERLGIEIQYRLDSVENDSWKPALPLL